MLMLCKLLPYTDHMTTLVLTTLTAKQMEGHQRKVARPE